MPDSPEGRLRFRIRAGDFEVELEGNISFVQHEYERLSKKFVDVATVKSPEVRVPGGDAGGIPTIKASKSTTENLKALFNTSWGTKPRSLAEILESLDANAATDSSRNVGSYLGRLVKSGTLRRIKKDGKWNYLGISQS